MSRRSSARWAPPATRREPARKLPARIPLALLALLPLLALFSPPLPLRADEAILAPPGEAVRLPLLARSLKETRRILYVTAHPDDEDAGLIAKLVHGDGVEVTLLTLTRGSGGQNEIGPELGPALAALRTAELESAHRWDGAVQWFGSAEDFGYSFGVEESLERWGELAMLRELVGAIRRCQPDAVITLPPGGAGGGQHHQASAILTERAIALAREDGWPELGAPHRVRRLLSVIWDESEAVDRECRISLDEFDPFLGATYAEVGARSRSMHKCQGMVTVDPPLPRRTVRLAVRFDETEVEGPLRHPLQGIPERSAWSEDAGGTVAAERLAQMAEERWRSSGEPGDDFLGIAFLRLVPALLEEARGHPDFAPLESARRQALALLESALGVRRRAIAAAPFAGTDEEAAITMATENGGGHAVEVRHTLIAPGHRGQPWTVSLAPGERDLRTVALPPGLPPTLLSGPVEPEIPDAPPPVRIESALRVLDGALRVDGADPWIELLPTPVVGVWRDPGFPALRESDLRIVPDPSIRPARRNIPAPRLGDGPARARGDFLVSARRAGVIEVSLAVPAGWLVEPAAAAIAVPGDGIEVALPFVATAPEEGGPANALVRAEARRADDPRDPPRGSALGYRRIDYPHIRTTALLERAEAMAVGFDCAAVPRRVGFIGGTDTLARAARALGAVTVELGGETRPGDLAEDLGRELAGLEVIAIGARAYELRADLRAAHPRLLEWARAGGTLVVEYQKTGANAADGTNRWVPHPGAAIGSGRITDETSPVRARDAAHPLLLAPNVIGPADWQGWVQERGLYFLDLAPGAPYVDILALEDPFPHNAGARGGALVEAAVGQGRWIYVGLGLGRQIEAGVPGAYRLLANLLAR